MNNKAYNNSNIKPHIASYFFTPIFYVVVGLIIFICITLTSCGCARAAEPYDGVSVDPYDINSLADALDYMNITFSQKQTILDAFEQYCPYYQIYFDNDYHSMAVNGTDVPGQYVTCPFVDSSTWRCSGMYYLAKADITPTYVLVCRIYGSSVQLYFKTPGSEGNYMTVFNSEFQSLYGSEHTFRQYYDNTGEVIISGDVSPECSNQSLFCYSVEGQHVLMQDNRANVRPLGETPINGFPDSHKFFIREVPSYTEDSRLKFSTSLRGDGERLLNTDLSDFLHWGPASGMSVSDLVLTLDCDGVEVPVSLDSNNSEIIFTKNQNDYSYRCVYVTPYSELGLDSFEDVTIIKCDFTRTYNHLGPDSPEVEDFKISCNYVLKNETTPIESDSISLDTSVDSDKLTAIEITDLHNSFQFSEGEFISDLSDIVAPDNFSFVEICVSTLPLQTLNNILSYVPYILLTPESGVNTTQAAEKVIYEYLEDNYYTCVFDYIIFDWVFYDDPEDPSAGYDHLYFYYNTLSGRVRLIDNVLGDIYVDVNQNTANTAAIYNYLYTRLNDFEDKSLDAFNDIIGLDRQRNSWLGTLSSGINNLSLISSNGFADVVDAVNAIEFDYVPFDDSDILSALSGIASQLSSILGRDDNEDDTVAESIAYYQLNNSSGLPTQQVFTDNKMSLWMSGKVHVWLQGSTAADSRQGLLIDSFDFMTQFYDSLQSHGLIGGVRNYVRSFTSGTSSGSAETVYKTIWTGSFNPNLKDGE